MASAASRQGLLYRNVYHMRGQPRLRVLPYYPDVDIDPSQCKHLAKLYNDILPATKQLHRTSTHAETMHIHPTHPVFGTLRHSTPRHSANIRMRGKRI